MRARPFGQPSIVLSQAQVQVIADPDIMSPAQIFQDVNPVIAHDDLVAGAGFEPAVRRLPDYEQIR